MSDEPTGNDETTNLIDSKKRPASEQVLSFYEVYAYHVFIIIASIILFGAPLVYNSLIGRSGILSGIVNLRNGYCSPFAEPNPEKKNDIEEINKFIYATGDPSNDDNYIIADQISFLQSLNACIKNTFKGENNDKSEGEEPSICSINYGKLIHFDYKKNVDWLLTPTNDFLKKYTQIQDLIQYLNINNDEDNPDKTTFYSLSDEFFTLMYGKASIWTFIGGVLFFSFVELPLDIIRRLFVLAIFLYDVIFGSLFYYLTYIFPTSFLETSLLLLPSILFLILPMNVVIGIIYYILDFISLLFFGIFVIYYFIQIGLYIFFIFYTYGDAINKTDLVFYTMKLLLFLGAVIYLILVFFAAFALFFVYGIFVRYASFLIMFIIFILPLFFTATIANDNKDQTEEIYSFKTFLKGLKYKQTSILLILLIVFVYDLFYCKVITMQGTNFGTMLIFIVLLFICGYFNNTLINTDNPDKNGMFSNWAINYYKTNGLKNDSMIVLKKEDYKMYNRKTLSCPASFGDSSDVRDKFNYEAFDVATLIMNSIEWMMGYKK